MLAWGAQSGHLWPPTGSTQLLPPCSEAASSRPTPVCTATIFRHAGASFLLKFSPPVLLQTSGRSEETVVGSLT